MNFLVLGGAGYIGSHLVRLAIDQNHNVDIFDNLSTSKKENINKDARFFFGDLRNPSDLDNVLRENRYDAVFHFAARSLVGESVRNPELYFDNNLNGTKNLLGSLAKNKQTNAILVFSSTCAVFGVPSKLPISEDDPKKPISPYGESKLMAERAIEDWCAVNGGKAVVFRYFNACGAHESGDIGEDHDPETHLIPNIIKAHQKNQQFNLFGTDFPTPDGTCLRDYIHVMDLAEAHLKGVEFTKNKPSGECDFFHLGTGVAISNLEIVSEVEKVLGGKVSINFSAARAGDPPELRAATQKTSDILGFKPSRSSLENIIKSAYLWHSKSGVK